MDEKMDEKLARVKATINNYFDELKSPAFDAFRPDFSLGKCLRSRLIFAIAKGEEPEIQKKSVQIAAIIELIHFASLLHDDVLDSATLRRNKITINAKHGDKSAIMLGDILYSKAFHEVARQSQTLAVLVSDCVLRLSLGELDDVALSAAFNLDEEKYLQMIANKTAALIETSAVCAGILRGESSEKYRIFGHSLGVAYQIIDDWLDIVGGEKLGKSAFSDLKEGKTTLPYIYLYRKMGAAERQILLGFFKKELDSKERGWIAEKIASHAIAKDIEAVVLAHKKRAESVLTSGDEALKEIVAAMLERDF